MGAYPGLTILKPAGPDSPTDPAPRPAAAPCCRRPAPATAPPARGARRTPGRNPAARRLRETHGKPRQDFWRQALSVWVLHGCSRWAVDAFNTLAVGNRIQP